MSATDQNDFAERCRIGIEDGLTYLELKDRKPHEKPRHRPLPHAMSGFLDSVGLTAEEIERRLK